MENNQPKTNVFSRVKQKMQLFSMKMHFGIDGYSNPAVSIGAASPLMASGRFVHSDLSDEELTTAYRENWLAKRIIDTPAEDMTRNWYTLSTAVSQEDMDELYRLEAEHSVKQEITNGFRWSRLYGGAIAIMIIDDFVDPIEDSLNPDSLLQDCFHGLLVLDRTQVEPSLEIETDIRDPEYGMPKYYTVYEYDENGGTIPCRYHHSRVLRFTGRELPPTEAEREDYWGASELEHIWDELMRRCSTAANITELVFRANLLCLKTGDLTEMLASGNDEHIEKVFRVMEAENHFRTSYGLQLLNANDSMENLNYDFAGLPQIYEQCLLDMAGAAEIPATKLFGRSPQGMNATGESDMRNYYEVIASRQERDLRPVLEKLLPVMAMSCWGYVPEDLQIRFEPMTPLSTGDQIHQAKEHSEMLVQLFQAGAITKEELREEMIEWSGRHGVLTKLKGKAGPNHK